MTRRIQNADQARLILAYDPEYAKTARVQAYLKQNPGKTVSDYVDKLSDAYARRVAGSLEKGRSLSEARGHKEEIVQRQERARKREIVAYTKRTADAKRKTETDFTAYMKKNPYRTEREFISGKKDRSPILRTEGKEWYEAEVQTLRAAGLRYKEILEARIVAGIKVEGGRVIEGSTTTREDLERFDAAWKEFRALRMQQLQFIRTTGESAYARYDYWDLRDRLKGIYDYMLTEFDLVDTRETGWDLFHYH